MDTIWAVLITILIAAGAVFVAVYYIVREFFANEAGKREAEQKRAGESILVPARMQAYERIVLLLERISPQSLIMRHHKGTMNARQFQAELIRHIRSEYEHNLSQQIYVSSTSWELVKTAKEETIKIINIASTKIPDSAGSLELSQKIFEVSGQLHKLPTEVAIEKIKKEFSSSF